MWESGRGVDYFRGSHTGYLRLTPPVAVTREIALVKDGPDVIVRDTVGGAGTRELVWRFHLDPSLAAEIVSGGVRLSALGPRGVASTRHAARVDLAMTIESGWSSPSYGVRAEIRVVVMRVGRPFRRVSRSGLVSCALRSTGCASLPPCCPRRRPSHCWNLNDASTIDEHGRRGRRADAAAVRSARHGAHSRAVLADERRHGDGAAAAGRRLGARRERRSSVTSSARGSPGTISARACAIRARPRAGSRRSPSGACRAARAIAVPDAVTPAPPRRRPRIATPRGGPSATRSRAKSSPSARASPISRRAIWWPRPERGRRITPTT